MTHDAEDPASDCIYLDCNGTTCIYPKVLESMMPYLTTYFGNPSSGHAYGRQPQQAINHARRQVLSMLGLEASPLSSVWWTSCGTEADNLAIQVALQATAHQFSATPGKLPHIVTSNVEHPAIEAYLKSLEKQGLASVSYVPVDTDGRLTLEAVLRALDSNENTILVTIMLANNESGALMPIREIAHACKERNILMHTDAAQAIGKVDITQYNNVDMMTIVGHKMGAPKGVACLYVRDGCLEESHRKLDNSSKHGIALLGGGQEFGRRSGTENVPYIVGLGTAAEMVQQDGSSNMPHMRALRERLMENLYQGLGKDKVRINGPVNQDDCLVNTLSVGIRDIHSGQLLAALQDRVAASAGATCHSNNDVSAVLRNMQVPMEFARGTLRLSVGPYTTRQDVDRASELILEQVQQQLKTSMTAS